MFQRLIKQFTFSLTLCLSVGMNFCHADVLVDMAKADEIVISNTQENIAYSFKVEESSEPILIASHGEQLEMHGLPLEDESVNNQQVATEVLLETTIDNTIIVSNNYNKQPANNIVASAIKNLPFNKEVQLAARETSVAPALIHAVISAESNHNPRARSAKGAMGLMQLMPETAKYYKVSNHHDPKQNILAGAKLLKDLLKVFNGDLKLTLAAYNAGLPAVIKHHRKIPPYKETQRYVPKVLSLYKKFT